jgi:hypothetical protein
VKELEMKLTQYVPACLNMDGIEIGSFDTTEELLNLPRVRRCRALVGFQRFSLSGDLLMVEAGDGLEWGVVGRLDEPGKVDLPKWELRLK